MPQQPASSEVLAHWHYPPELWRDFVQYESGVYRKSIRSARHFVIGTIVVSLILIILFSVIPFLVTGKFDSNIWGPAFGISIIAEVCLLAGVLVLKARKKKFAELAAKPGEVIIKLDQIKINDLSFEWSYGETGWQFLDAERKTVAVDPLKKMEILELKFVIFVPSKNTPQRDEAEWRVPIEMGHETEADRIITRLRSEVALHTASPQNT